MDGASLAERMREAYTDQDPAQAIGQRGRASVVNRFSWGSAANRFLEIALARHVQRPMPELKTERPVVSTERSPYWLGLRVSVVIPTHNRKLKLLACLDALERQSVLSSEFEVIVVDDGSTDGTGEALDARTFRFGVALLLSGTGRAGPLETSGSRRPVASHVLFIGDDILADERLLEEHLLAHAATTTPGLAVLGRIDWPSTMTPNAVMEYVCGDAMLQFAYTYIPRAPALDHRFFYTSNISLKREFLVDAADDGVRFDTAFRYAAFEDPNSLSGCRREGSESAMHPGGGRPRSLDGSGQLCRTRAHAGAMAVVFYRKHPGADDQLRVRWIAELVEPARDC